MEFHEGDDVEDIKRDVVAEIRAVLAAVAPASAAAAHPSDVVRGDDSGMALQAWLAAATAPSAAVDADLPAESGSKPSASPLTRTDAVIAQEKALQAAMVAHAVAGGTEDVAHAAAAAARVAEEEARRAEALLVAVAASARLSPLTRSQRRGDDTS